MTTNHATCLTPSFEWNNTWGVWGTCQSCARLAWDHEQADPLADIRAHITNKHRPPVMRPVTPTGEIVMSSDRIDEKVIEISDDGVLDLTGIGRHSRYDVRVHTPSGVIVLLPVPGSEITPAAD